jgi:hypothetical protein
MNELKAVHMPSETHREFRSLVKYRKTLDHRINKMKCTIRAWFVNHGISIDAGDKAWHTGRELINSFRKLLVECESNELWKGELDIELTQLDALTTQLDIVVKKLETIGKNDPRIQRIRTIPGVGPRTAEILVACIDNPHRFTNGRQVSAYFGLVPRQYQSGETDRNGRITKRGNTLARTILVESAWASLRYNDWAEDCTAQHDGLRQGQDLPNRAKHRHQMTRMFHMDIPRESDSRNIRRVALKNVPAERKVACSSSKHHASHSQTRTQHRSRCLNRAWITEGTQLAHGESPRVKCVRTSNSRFAPLIDHCDCERPSLAKPRTS